MSAEQTYQRRILSWLRRQPRIFAFKIITANISGIPDVIAVVRGRFVAIEVKSQDGHTSRIQKYIHNKIKKAGGVALVSRPSNYEEFKATINNLEGVQSYE